MKQGSYMPEKQKCTGNTAVHFPMEVKRMNIITKKCNSIAVIAQDKKISSTQDLLDLIGDIWSEGDCNAMILFHDSLDKSFFDLRTGFAGEILQKLSNYNFKMAVVGDFSSYTSKSLKDFIYECNKGRFVFFKDNVESAADALAG